MAWSSTSSGGIPLYSSSRIRISSEKRASNDAQYHDGRLFGSLIAVIMVGDKLSIVDGAILNSCSYSITELHTISQTEWHFHDHDISVTNIQAQRAHEKLLRISVSPSLIVWERI